MSDTHLICIVSCDNVKAVYIGNGVCYTHSNLIDYEPYKYNFVVCALNGSMKSINNLSQIKFDIGLNIIDIDDKSGIQKVHENYRLLTLDRDNSQGTILATFIKMERVD